MLICNCVVMQQYKATGGPGVSVLALPSAAACSCHGERGRTHIEANRALLSALHSTDLFSLRAGQPRGTNQKRGSSIATLAQLVKILHCKQVPDSAIILCIRSCWSIFRLIDTNSGEVQIADRSSPLHSKQESGNASFSARPRRCRQFVVGYTRYFKMVRFNDCPNDHAQNKICPYQVLFLSLNP